MAIIQSLWLRTCIVLLCMLLVPVAAASAAQTKQDSQAIQLTGKYAKYASEEQFILINKSTNRLMFYEKGKLVKSFPVATGRKPSLTPEGLFTLHEKIKNRPYYKEKIKGGDPKNPLGDRWLGLEVKIGKKVSYAYGIHGTNNEKSIGKYVSSGCIRMHNKDVRWLFEQIDTGIPVLIVKK